LFVCLSAAQRELESLGLTVVTERHPALEFVRAAQALPSSGYAKPIPNSHSDSSLITLPTGSLFPVLNSNRLFVRSFYPSLYEKIFNKCAPGQLWLIKGNEGIGIIYFVCLLLSSFDFVSCCLQVNPYSECISRFVL
jgi:hypothetical protein